MAAWGVSGVALVLALVAGGCKAVGPDYQAPAISTPEAWATSLVGGVGAGEQTVTQWWTLMGDEQLSALVERAAGANTDLRVAQARVREARAAYGIVAAGDKPTVDVGAGYSRSASSETTGNFPDGFAGDGRDLYRAGFDASWELDVFGGVRRSVEAAGADIEGAEWALRDVRVSLTAEVARLYVQLRTFQQRLSIARQNVESQRQTLELTESRLKAGLTSELDVTRARSQLATTRASIPAFETGVAQSIYGLSTLCAQHPGVLVEQLSAPGSIPAPAGALPIGVPADLVRRRADVRGAERALAAQTARVGVATADLYPSFDLGASIGLASGQLGRFFDGNSREWSIAPGVRWNVLDFGRIRANIGVQEARVEQQLAAYEGRVLTALREVDSAVVGFARAQERTSALGEAVAAQQRAVELATKLYREGLADFISVLDTQRQLFALQDQEVESRGEVTLQLVTLFKSLGGGWEPTGEPTRDAMPVRTSSTLDNAVN